MSTPLVLRECHQLLTSASALSVSNPRRRQLCDRAGDLLRGDLKDLCLEVDLQGLDCRELWGVCKCVHWAWVHCLGAPELQSLLSSRTDSRCWSSAATSQPLCASAAQVCAGPATTSGPSPTEAADSTPAPTPAPAPCCDPAPAGPSGCSREALLDWLLDNLEWDSADRRFVLTAGLKIASCHDEESKLSVGTQSLSLTDSVANGSKIESSGSKTYTVKGNLTTTIDSNQTTTIGANQTTIVRANQTTKVNANQSTTVIGRQTTTVGAEMDMKAKEMRLKTEKLGFFNATPTTQDKLTLGGSTQLVDRLARLGLIRVNNTGDGNTGNTASGFNSLHSNTTGNSNTASGYQSLYKNTTGEQNTATGYQSLYKNTGNSNTATGYQSLYSNTNAYGNTASGYQSLYSNTTGEQNTATGYQSLYKNTEGEFNTASGYYSLYFNTTGEENTATGYQSLYKNTTGGRNTAYGFESLQSNKNGNSNTATGHSSLFSNINGGANTATGEHSLVKNTTGSNNTAVGYYTAQNCTTGSFNTVIGYQAKVEQENAQNQIVIGANETGRGDHTAVIGGDRVYMRSIVLECMDDMDTSCTTDTEHPAVTGQIRFDGTNLEVYVSSTWRRLRFEGDDN